MNFEELTGVVKYLDTLIRSYNIFAIAFDEDVTKMIEKQMVSDDISIILYETLMHIDSVLIFSKSLPTISKIEVSKLLVKEHLTEEEKKYIALFALTQEIQAKTEEIEIIRKRLLSSYVRYCEYISIIDRQITINKAEEILIYAKRSSDYIHFMLEDSYLDRESMFLLFQSLNEPKDALSVLIKQQKDLLKLFVDDCFSDDCFSPVKQKYEQLIIELEIIAEEIEDVYQIIVSTYKDFFTSYVSDNAQELKNKENPTPQEKRDLRYYSFISELQKALDEKTNEKQRQ